jgi:hypothetical protein
MTLMSTLLGGKMVGYTTLCQRHPFLYNIVHHNSDTIAMVMESSPSVVMFRRDLSGPKLAYWNALFQHMAFVQLTLGTKGF